ncbi:MAG TPA: hypothetical protein VIH86_05270 [Puia sp.]
MNNIFKSKKNIWLLSPSFGTLIYLLLYIIATFFYPGGSQADKNSVGFSWTQNYWCNLLNENAINGQHNATRPIAIVAMFFLCITLMVFWYIFPKQTGFRKSRKLIVQVSGFASMISIMFISTALHDIVINIATVFGLIAVIGTFIGLLELKWTRLFWVGIFILPLVALNNFLYYKTGLLIYLPVVQKITFLYFLLWICLIDVGLYKNSFNTKSTAQF